MNTQGTKLSIGQKTNMGDTTLKVSEMYPKMLNELNDATSPIPAYMRFQKQDANNCYLRDDLSALKQQHFKKNYSKELNKTKNLMNEVEYQNQELNSGSYFELKYFLTQQ